MSVLKDILDGVKTTIEMNGRLVAIAGSVDRLAADVRDIDRRLVRVETIVEIARPDGAVLRIAPPDRPGRPDDPT